MGDYEDSGAHHQQHRSIMDVFPSSKKHVRLQEEEEPLDPESKAEGPDGSRTGSAGSATPAGLPVDLERELPGSGIGVGPTLSPSASAPALVVSGTRSLGSSGGKKHISGMVLQRGGADRTENRRASVDGAAGYSGDGTGDGFDGDNGSDAKVKIRTMRMTKSAAMEMEAAVEQATTNQMHQLFFHRFFWKPFIELVRTHKTTIFFGISCSITAAILNIDSVNRSITSGLAETKADVPELWSLFRAVAVYSGVKFFADMVERFVMLMADLVSNTWLWMFWFYISSLEKFISASILFIVIVSSWKELIVFGDESNDNPEWVDTAHLVLVGILICNLMFVGRQILLKWLLWQLEAKNFIERANSTRDNEKVITRLAKVAFIFKPLFSGRRRQSVDSTYQKTMMAPVSDKSVLAMLKSLQKETTFKVPHANLASQYSEQKQDIPDEAAFKAQKSDLENVTKFTELRSEKKCKVFAEKLFKKLVSDGKGALEMDDFYEFFSKENEAESAYLLMRQGSSTTPLTSVDDIIGPTYIDMDTFIASVQRMREQKLHLSSDLQSFSSVFAVLSTVIKGVSWIAVPLIIAGVLGVSLNAIALTTTSVMVSMAFAFGSSIARTVESAYFLLITRPFKVGDRIRIGNKANDIFIVKEITLMSTAAATLDQQMVFLPNYELARQYVFNLNRIETSTLVIDFQIGFTTTAFQIENLRNALKDYAKANKEVFKASAVNLYFDGVQNQNKIVMSLWMGTRLKWQEGAQLWPARSKLIEFLKDESLKLGIHYEQSPQPVQIPHGDIKRMLGA